MQRMSRRPGFCFGFASVLLALLFCFALISRPANAQATSPAGTITATPASGVAPLSVALSWNLTNAYNCVASGAAAFTGAKPASGTATVILQAGEVPAIKCEGRGFVELNWTHDGLNVDGFTIWEGSSADALKESPIVVSPLVRKFLLTGVASGPKFYALDAYKLGELVGTERTKSRSDRSNITSKTIVPPSVTFAAAVTVTAPPIKPNPPTDLYIAAAPVAGLNMAPTFKLTTTGKRAENYSAYVPLGEPCVGGIVFYFRDKPFRKVSARNALWPAGIVPSDSIAAQCVRA